jgi:hypothetical protein
LNSYPEYFIEYYYILIRPGLSNALLIVVKLVTDKKARDEFGQGMEKLWNRVILNRDHQVDFDPPTQNQRTQRF